MSEMIVVLCGDVSLRSFLSAMIAGSGYSLATFHHVCAPSVMRDASRADVVVIDWSSAGPLVALRSLCRELDSQTIIVLADARPSVIPRRVIWIDRAQPGERILEALDGARRI